MLAERLGRTVDELEASMSHAELVRWAAHDDLTAFEREHAQREAEMNARVRGGR